MFGSEIGELKVGKKNVTNTNCTLNSEGEVESVREIPNCTVPNG